MDKRTEKILDLLTFYKADDVKALQAKFTRLGKGIQREALEGRVKTVFSSEQQSVLSEAAEILMGVKRSVEHAKKVKAREEKERDAIIADAKSTATTYLCELTASLSLTEKIAISLSDDIGSGWPFGDPKVIMETAKGTRERGLRRLENSFEQAISDWIDVVSDRLGWEAAPNRYRLRGNKVTKEIAKKRLEKAIQDAHRFNIFAGELSSEVSASFFIKSIKSALTTAKNK